MKVSKIVFLMTMMVLTCSQSAWALQETRCSDPKGELMRVEEEVWGSNVVYWNYKGQRFEENEIQMNQDSANFHGEKEVMWNGLPSRETSYSINVKTPDNKTVSVICQEIKNDAID